ncbi:MAG: MotE family protein [Xanthobacteraceae bacterium]
MTRILRDFRLIPIVLVAITGLFALKSLGLIFDGGYTLGELARGGGDDVDITGTIGTPAAGETGTPAADPKATSSGPRSWAQQVFNFPDVTGSVGATKDAKKDQPQPKGDTKADPKAKAKPKNPPAKVEGKVIPLEGGRLQSPAERALLARLAERRVELEKRAQEIDMRESLVLAAEKRLEGRIAKLKQLESRINEAVRTKDEEEAARFKNVIAMYENMKAKDAARIFDRLEMRVLAEVATQINPRRMSDILAQMSPAAAERLTMELARRAKDQPPAELPKIDGRPTAN